VDGHAFPGFGLLPGTGLPEAREAAQDRVYWRMFTKHVVVHAYIGLDWMGLRQGAFSCVGWQLTLCDPI